MLDVHMHIPYLVDILLMLGSHSKTPQTSHWGSPHWTTRQRTKRRYYSHPMRLDTVALIYVAENGGHISMGCADSSKAISAQLISDRTWVAIAGNILVSWVGGRHSALGYGLRLVA